MTAYLTLGVVATLWCVIHSALISRSFMGFVTKKFGEASALHRLLYSILSIATLIPVVGLMQNAPNETLFRFDGMWSVVRWSVLLLSLIIFFFAARRYNQRFFFGIQQAKDFLQGKPQSQPRFSRGGIHEIVRHPYYIGGIVFLLTYADFTVANTIVRAVFIIYLIIGTFIEEKKLVDERGEQYEDYQKEVPMLIPSLLRIGKLLTRRRDNG